MEFLRGIFEKANDFFESFMAPIVDKIADFFTSNEYFAIGIVGVFVAMLLIVGLFRWLRKKPVLFIVLLGVFAAVMALWLVSK